MIVKPPFGGYWREAPCRRAKLAETAERRFYIHIAYGLGADWRTYHR